jgi:YbbR domain-containing protein
MKRLLKIFFVSNVRNKTTALVLAVVIWLVVSFEVSDEYKRDDVIVEIVPLKDGVAMKDIAVEPSPIVVKARFTAPKRIGQQYLASAVKVRAVHKIENPVVGDWSRIELNREDFDLPYDIKLVEVKPRRLSVILRRIVTRKLRVKVELRGCPASGYELSGDPQVEPTEVSVRGPKETLEVADHILTEPVDIEGRSISFSSDYSLTDSLDGKPIETTTKVRVRVTIRPAAVVKTFSIPVHVNVTPGYEHEALLPRAGEGGVVNLSIKGPGYLLNEPGTAGKISAFVVVTPEMKPRREIPYSAKVHLFVPPELGGLKLAGEHYVDLEIRKKEPQEPKKTKGP